jgi:hypothetical protein
MTTGGLLVGGLGMGIAQADSAATGAAAGSPGLLSGNLIQIPVNAPVNVCGNSISVIGILDTAAGNSCANTGSDGSTAKGGAADSPGVGSGNLIQVPVNAPVNVCGNSVSVIGIGDSAHDNSCSNGGASGSGSSGSTAKGGSSHSPGIGSGNTIQLPVNTPVNLCGNSISLIGIGDTAADNSCSNGPSAPPTRTPPPPPCGCHPTAPKPQSASTPAKGTLAETGSGAAALVAPLGAGVFGGSGLLLRKRMSALQKLAGRKG